MSAPHLAYPLFDADNHLYETPGFADQVPAKRYKDAIQYVQVNGRTKIAIRGRSAITSPIRRSRSWPAPGAQEDYYQKGNPEGKSRREIFGEPIRGIPAFREPGHAWS